MKYWSERFVKDERGATAIEYGLIAAGIAVAIIVAVSSVGSGLNTTFTSVQTALKWSARPLDLAASTDICLVALHLGSEPSTADKARTEDAA
jgi:pilus assembly protein Flp/PilA